MKAKGTKQNIYLADYIESPFVMGLLHPRIYLPSTLVESEREYILLHEQHHIRRGDHIVKFLAFVALCIHWFNPLVWLAFVLAGKDMEMSCDEAVVKKLGEQIRADYSASLLKLATGKRILAGMPLAFGEGDTKGRIKNLGKWKKPKVWISVLAVVVCIIVAVVCFVNPKSEPDPAEVVGEYDVSRLGGEFLQSGNPAYEVGVNAYGMPVFKDYKAAFRAMEEDYGEAIAFIQEQFDLPTLTMSNYGYGGYALHGAQVVTGDEELRADCMAVAQFLDLYENSFDYGSYIRVDWEPTKSGDAESLEGSPYSPIGGVEPVKADLIQGVSYISHSCLYMSLLSSTFSNGDTGDRYLVGEDSFTFLDRSTGNKRVISSVEWGWQAFPWTDEQWVELYSPSLSSEYKISQYYDEMLYQPLSGGDCLLSMDGELWLVNLRETPQNQPYIWSIFTLKPETVKMSVSSRAMNREVLPYIGMTRQEYEEKTGGEISFLHTNFYATQIEGGNCRGIFCATGYNSELLNPVLFDSDRMIRVEGALNELIPGLAEEMTVDAFVKWLADGSQMPDYEVKYGAGTVYYVGDSYLEIPVDSDGDGFGDMGLQIALDKSEIITPNANAWLSWMVE